MFSIFLCPFPFFFLTLNLSIPLLSILIIWPILCSFLNFLLSSFLLMTCCAFPPISLSLYVYICVYIYLHARETVVEAVYTDNVMLPVASDAHKPEKVLIQHILRIRFHFSLLEIQSHYSLNVLCVY